MAVTKPLHVDVVRQMQHLGDALELLKQASEGEMVVLSREQAKSVLLTLKTMSRKRIDDNP